MRKPELTKKIEPSASSTVLARLATADVPMGFEAILRVIAEVLDSACKGEESFVTFGVNRARDSLIATVVFEGSKTYAAGGDIESLGESVAGLL